MDNQKNRIILHKSKHEDHHYLGFDHKRTSHGKRTPLTRKIFGIGVNASKKITKFYASFKTVLNQNNYS